MDFSYDIKLEALEELPPSLGGRSISLLSWWRETSFRFAVRTVCRDGNRHIVSTPSTWLEMLLRAYPPQGRKFPCYWACCLVPLLPLIGHAGYHLVHREELST